MWKKIITSPGGLEPPTFRLTAERANRLRHGDIHIVVSSNFLLLSVLTFATFTSCCLDFSI